MTRPAAPAHQATAAVREHAALGDVRHLLRALERTLPGTPRHQELLTELEQARSRLSAAREARA
ncbi:hypothetical protein DNL40_02610 [Xylanimonas oleitrophica]|uniref:Uncharacterized protein n=1 Tax=Xylanimonas oleitrophica TaxID=2607479 RepID=A0A2W5YJC2_9MICO|nr:hypothetical protein [Xylanimonas oleitrophica]PZR55281.1 hypothetical protein DNL40_02610 [Xylanimonas oleitrophica]